METKETKSIIIDGVKYQIIPEEFSVITITSGTTTYEVLGKISTNFVGGDDFDGGTILDKDKPIYKP